MWHGRAACGLIGLLATLVAFVALALTLLKAPFFASIVRPEPKSITTCDTPKHGILYAVIYLICLLPAPLLYYWLVGYPYYMQPQWFMFVTKFMPNDLFNMAPVNSLMLFNIVIGVILMVVYVLVFQFIARKAGFTLENTGLKLPLVQVVKSLILAVVPFGVIYAIVYACAGLSGTEFSFFKYLPVWLFFFLLVSVIYNSFTRINNAPAWINYLLIAVASCGGLAVMFAYDYGTLFATGVRGIPYIPGTTSAEWIQPKYVKRIRRLHQDVWNTEFINPFDLMWKYH